MNILFICTGNTCRSPMAEGYLKSLNIPDINVKSRGLCADGSVVSQNSVLACREKGIDISSHISKQISLEDIALADKIICMSPSHIQSLMNVAKDKLFVLGGGIPDPFMGDLDCYRKCRDSIFAAIDIMFIPFNIIPLERKHIKEVALLEEVCFSTPWSEQTLLEAFSSGIKFFVSEKDGRILGYIGISCILDEGYITNIAVFPQYRKMGIGTALIKRVFKLAEELSLSFVSLEVRESNQSAISLYNCLGFKKEGERKGFYTNPTENALILTKRFE